MEINNKNRLVFEIVLIGVIVYLWQKRCKKNKTIEEAKAGADITPSNTTTADSSTSTQSSECGSVTSDCMGTDTSKNSQLGKTISISDSNANFSGGNGKGVKAQYFR
jgi:hypothetical protein